MQRAVILCEDSTEIGDHLLSIDMDAQDLNDNTGSSIFEPARLASRSNGSSATEDLSLEDYFQRFVLEHQDTMSETELARKLGVSRKCLWERRQRLGIPRTKAGASASSGK